MSQHALRPRLVEGVNALDLRLEEEQAMQLLSYLDLLSRWNKVYNLTAVRDPAEMLSHHLLDSLAVIKPLRQYTQGKPIRLLDVGSGGGLPGVVIAICCREIEVTCVDAVTKKTSFIQQAAGSLNLRNLHSLHARVETVSDKFDVVASRAFASLGDFTQWSKGALTEEGVWMAMKGRYPEVELAQLPSDITVFHVEQLDVPHLDAERCIVWLRRRVSGASD